MISKCFGFDGKTGWRLGCHVKYHNYRGTGGPRHQNVVTLVVSKPLCLLKVFLQHFCRTISAQHGIISAWVCWRGMNYVTAYTSTEPHLLPQQQQQQRGDTHFIYFYHLHRRTSLCTPSLSLHPTPLSIASVFLINPPLPLSPSLWVISPPPSVTHIAPPPSPPVFLSLPPSLPLAASSVFLGRRERQSARTHTHAGGR